MTKTKAKTTFTLNKDNAATHETGSRNSIWFDLRYQHFLRSDDHDYKDMENPFEKQFSP